MLTPTQLKTRVIKRGINPYYREKDENDLVQIMAKMANYPFYARWGKTQSILQIEAIF